MVERVDYYSDDEYEQAREMEAHEEQQERWEYEREREDMKILPITTARSANK